MQNGNRWIVREKVSGKWIKSVGDSPFRIELVEDMAEALRYGTRFRAEDDASFLSRSARSKKGNASLRGMVFEVYEFEDSDRPRQADPHLVFTPRTKEGKA